MKLRTTKISLLSIKVLIFFVFAVFFVYFLESWRPNTINKTLTNEDIDKVYIINLDRSKDRRKDYENLLKKHFGGKFFNKNLKNARLSGTDGKVDILIQDMQTKQTIKAIEFLRGKRSFEYGKLYHIYDKRDRNLFIKYRPNKHSGRFIKIGELGCTLSHLRAMKDIVKNEYSHGIVMEDDFVFFNPKEFYEDFDKMLAKTPKDYDVIKFDIFSTGKNSKYVSKVMIVRLMENIKSYITNGFNWYLNNQNNKKMNATTGYIISYNGAKKMMNLIENNIFDSSRVAIDDLMYKEAIERGQKLNIYYAKRPLISQRDVIENRVGDIKGSVIDQYAVEFKIENEFRHTSQMEQITK